MDIYVILYQIVHDRSLVATLERIEADMNAAIVDDSVEDIELLCSYLSQYSQEHKIHIYIERFTDADAFLDAVCATAYQLVFLDIYMEGMTGIQVAEQIQAKDPRCQIIFTTVSAEHAPTAFRMHVLDYLVKPYGYAYLEDALDHYGISVSRLSYYIELKEGRERTRIPISDIVYTDYSNHYIQVHTVSCVIRSYMSFGDFYPMLAPYPNFLWCYRNCMVNMDFIESYIDRDFILKNGESIPITASRKREVLQTYADYIFDSRSQKRRKV